MKVPDCWVMLKVKNSEGGYFYKTLMGWTGSYLGGSSWWISSRIVEILREGDYFLLKTKKGSVYKCHQRKYELKPCTAGIYNQLKKQFEDDLLLVEDVKDWLDLKTTFSGV